MTLRKALLALAVGTMAVQPALAGNVYLDWNHREPRLPECAAPSVQAAVRRTIARADRDYRDGMTIESLSHIAQSAYVKDRPSPLARRYCRASAETLQDGHRFPRQHRIYYMIEEYQAFVGLGWNVEVCVQGHDRWYVYDAHCRTVRP